MIMSDMKKIEGFEEKIKWTDLDVLLHIYFYFSKSFVFLKTNMLGF